MKIVIDARMYSESGVGRYIRNLMNQLQLLDKKNEYRILLLKRDFDQLNLNKNFTKMDADFKWYGLSEQTKLPRILKKINPDLVHFPHFNIAVSYKGRFVVTIHDLIHQHFKMRRATTLNPLTYKIKQLGYDFIFKKAITKSQKIIVPSNFVKESLIKNWGVLDDKIIVTYEAVDDKIVNLNQDFRQSWQGLLEKFKIKSDYIFYVGNAHPHKNVEGLIKAFLRVKKRFQNLQLVLSGSDHYFWQRIKKQYSREDIIYTGFVSDTELVALYKNAKSFIMPSFEEGFGIPLLEAMACGCPVVSSSCGSLKEVGGEACIYFDPAKLDDMVNKMFQVLSSEELRKELIEKGFKRYKEFSWEKLGKLTMEVYTQCV